MTVKQLSTLPADRIAALEKIGKNTPPGLNVSRLGQAEWRRRLIEAAGDMSFREISERAIMADGSRLIHTTIRNVFVGSGGGCNINTLAAIADAVNVDLVWLLTGVDTLKAVAPQGAVLDSFGQVAAIPIVPLPEVDQWRRVIGQPNLYTEIWTGPLPDVDACGAARVIGIDCAPELHDGDWVLFNPLGHPRVGGLTIVKIGNEPCICRRWQGGTKRITLSAPNTDVPNRVVDANSIRMAWPVVKKLCNL